MPRRAPTKRRPATTSIPSILTAIALLSAPVGSARAQTTGDPPPESPPPDRDSGASVPTGGAGAVIVPGKEAPPPKPVKLTMPKLVTYAAPIYPPEAQAAGVQGEVGLKLDIDATGKVTKAEVVQPAGHGFDEAALAAAPNLVFEPAKRPDGTPVPSRILYKYTFTLTPKTATAPPADIDSITATVLAAGTNEPLPGVTATLKRPDGTTATATTDLRGQFKFKNLPPGKYHVDLTSPGFDTLGADEELAESEAIEVKYRLTLTPQPRAGGKGAPTPVLEVTVKGERPAREVTKRTLERREIERIPGTGGDAIRSVQNLPGVGRSAFGGGLLIVRGSAPQDTLTFIDQTPVPIIYHFGGLSSVVPTEMLEKIDFYPGNFSTEFGRAMGGIVDVGLRSPRTDGKYHGVAQLDFIDGRLVVEGPIPFLKNWSFIAGGRRSWVDAWLGPVLTEVGAGITQAPRYYDYQFVVEGRISEDERFRASFYGSDDAFELIQDEAPENEPALTGSFGLHTAFQRLQFTYEKKWAQTDRLSWMMAFGRDNLDFQVGPLYFLLDVRTLSNRLEYSHKFAKWLTMNVGADINGGLATVNLRIPSRPLAGQPEGQPFSTRPFAVASVDTAFSRPAAYAELEVVPSARARFVPGVRVDYALDTKSVDVSPRISGRYAIKNEFPKTTVKGGVGLFYQPPQFQQSSAQFGTPGLLSNRAVHYTVGAEQDITKQIEVSLEGFYKDLDRQVVFNPRGDGYTNDGAGYAVGGELMLKYKPDERFFGWLAYTLSRSARTNPPDYEEVLANFDQTHVLTMLGSFRIGRGWEAGARFRLVSGPLITPVICDPTAPDCNTKRLNAVFHAPSNQYYAIPSGADNSERLPLFHQLDLRVDKTWQFKSWKFAFYLDIQNVYNNQAAEGLSYNFNFTNRQYVTGLPILPTVGFRGDF